MSSTLPSDEVGEDYKSSLEDLVVNDRNQIGVLTVIAKENTEHAMAISRVLENHIRNAPPARKLPALYVLDSIVKNVGTPYTLYFQRNLYQTFMGAYTLVDSNIRKKLDEMLKTWKEPVPGSLDTRPVFPADTTREIESALIKARTAALQQQARTQSAHPQLRATATPPSHWRNTPPPNPQAQYIQQAPAYPPQSRSETSHYPGSQYPTQHFPVQPPQVQAQYPPQPNIYQPPASSSVDLNALNRDIESLIAAARVEFANNIGDAGVQARLKALLDLQIILRTKTLPEHQLRQIRDQVSQLAPAIQTQPRPTPPPAAIPVPVQVIAPTPPLPLAQQQPTPQPAGIPSFINSSSLAELIRATASRNQPTPPPPQANLPLSLPQAVRTPPIINALPAVSAPENPLIAQLRSAGLLPSTGTPPMNGALPFTPPNGFPVPSTFFPPTAPPTLSMSVKFTSASIKTPRPNLIVSLYDDRPNRCTTCGRRFGEDPKGKEKKARHLDWHFKTNTRLSEAAKRGQSRSWYVDEREWISSREYEDDEEPVDNPSTLAAAAAARNKTQQQQQESFILAPNDPILRNAPCPICQEKFESTWSEERQEFIWKDALRIGNRIYHASCYREATKDKEKVNAVATGAGAGAASGGGTALGNGNAGPNAGMGAKARTATPDSVLGKRKAETEAMTGIDDDVHARAHAHAHAHAHTHCLSQSGHGVNGGGTGGAGGAGGDGELSNTKIKLEA